MTRGPAAAGREQRQFGLLTRASTWQVLSAATRARDADPMQFALWGTALAMTPPSLVAVRKVIDYPFLLRAPTEYVERVILADRLFFVLYAMLAAALFGALVWDALSPSKHDHEVLGVLPVRPRTVAAARFVATLGLCGVFLATITAPSALLYSAASAVHPLVGAFPRILVAHLAACLCAGLFVFLALVFTRAVLVVVVGDRLAGRLAVALQILTLVTIVQAFLFLPGILPQLLKDVANGGASYGQLPPMWFTGLFLQMADGRVVRAGLAGTALASLLLSVVFATVLSLAPAAVLKRRELERRTDVAISSLARLAIRLAARLMPSARSSALYAFGIASLTRSRGHAVHLGTYVGLAVAATTTGIATSHIRGTLSFDAPQTTLLAIPLVAAFFGVLGLRSACSIPVEIDANWPLRLRQPPLGASVAAMRLILLTLVILPIVGVAAVATIVAWGWWVGLSLAMLNTTAGVLLTELALYSWDKVPFATMHEPNLDAIRTRWPWLVVALFVFAFVQARLQLGALGNAARLAWLEAALVAAILVVLVRNRQRYHHQRLTFDADEDTLAVMRLSPAQE